ncbi:MAG: hypothetical protein AAGC55_28210, partial [Myxococcota bacterium]
MTDKPAHSGLAAIWPHARALFVAFHVLAVIVLSLPSPHSVANRRTWQTKNHKDSIARWSERLSWLGYDSPDQFESDLWDLVQGYVKVRETFIAPFQSYARLSCARQGWRMFATPQRHPGELHIDIREGGTWRPIYRPHSDDYDFWADKFTHNRFRKVSGRLSRGVHRSRYNHMTRFLAGKVAQAYPEADKIRFRLYRYKVRDPAAVRAGQDKDGRYEKER